MAVSRLSTAQIKDDLIAIPATDSVALCLTIAPGSNEAFHVYRQGPLPTNADYVWLTKDAPIRPVIDADEVKVMLGDQWELLSKAFNTEEPFDVLRRLRGDNFIGLAHSLISPRIARLTGRWYLDTKLKPGAQYNYKVVVVNNRGNEIRSYTKKVTVTPVLPKPPTALKAETGDGQVTLTWEYPNWGGSFSDLAMQYYVYRKEGTGDFARIPHKPIIRDDLASPTYTDLWLDNGKTYTYYVTAVDPLSRQSKPSPEASATPVDTKPPASPNNLAVVSGDGIISLSWDMSLELDAAGYNVYRSVGLKEPYEKLNKSLLPVDKSIYFDSSIANGLQYFYAVTAVDKSKNESAKCNPMAVIGEDKTPPDAPTNLAYSLKNRILTLHWTPSKAKDVAGYYVYRGLTPDIEPKIIFEPYKDTIFVDKGYQDLGLTAGKTFWVSVTAADKSRNESPKVTLEIKIPDDEPPFPPQSFIAENVDGRFVHITCGNSASLDVAKYKVLRAAGGGDSSIAAFTEAPFEMNDSSVAKGTRYIYYAIAVDSAGNKSRPSYIDTILVRDFSAPPSPRNCTAKVTDSGIMLNWEKAIDFDMNGYNVYRSTLPSGVYEKLNTSPLKDLQFLDKSGTATHYYRIKSVDTSGNESTRSEAIHAG